MKASRFSLLGIITFLLVASPAGSASPLLYSFQQAKNEGGGEAGELKKQEREKGGRVSLRVDYLRKQDATQREDYTRVAVAYETKNRFYNPRAGMEVRMDNAEFLTLWFGDDIVIDPAARVHLRFHHVRYGEWETSINYLAFYYSYHWRWLWLAVGIAYSVMNFDEKNYWNPFVFTSDSPETRFLYEVSIRPPLWKNRIDLDLGFRNFDDAEYHGFDDNGYHVGAIFHLNEDTTLSYVYDRRYAAAFISLPTLTRTTWMVSVEHRF